MSLDVEHRLRYVLGEREQCRGRIVALLREAGVPRLLRMRTPPSHRPIIDALASLLKLEAELNDAIRDAARALDASDDEADE